MRRGNEIKLLDDELSVLSQSFLGRELLTPRELVVLAQIVRGSSSREIARRLGVSPRTIDFHRANIMHKLEAKNAVHLVRKVVSDIDRPEENI